MDILTVEIITIGNELLAGRVINTNASWIADRVTKLGGLVKRITVVGDDVEECSLAVREALARKPRLLITTGGLGPTFDDRTLESLSIAIGVPIELNDEAKRMVEEKYKGELTPQRLKLAKLPKGGKPLYNPTGKAPGCLLEAGETIIVALPGVPSEMKAMFKIHVEPMISRFSKNFYSLRALRVRGVGESLLAPLVEEVIKKFKNIFVKTYPKDQAELLVEVELSCRAPTREEAEKTVLEACKALVELVTNLGAEIDYI